MEQTVIQQIKNGDDRVFLELYQKYRNIFIKSAISQFNCPLEEAKDVFQDIMCIFHQNIMNGQLQTLTVPIEQYLWKVANYHLINLKKRQQKEKDITNLLSSETELEFISNDSNKINYQIILHLIRKLRPKDQKLLTLRYYHNYCMEAIARELGYRNPQVVRNRKRKIINKLISAFKAEKSNKVIT